MVRVILTLEMPDWWGADDAFDAGGEKAVRELVEEDLRAFTDEASWVVARVGKSMAEDRDDYAPTYWAAIDSAPRSPPTAIWLGDSRTGVMVLGEWNEAFKCWMPTNPPAGFLPDRWYPLPPKPRM